MAKFGELNIGVYDKLWSNNDKKYLQKFIDDTAMLNVNYTFAYQHFVNASMPTETQPSGEALFRVFAKKNVADEMADFRAPLSDNTAMDKTGFTDYMGTIPDIGKGFYEKAAERYQKEKLFEQFGNDATLVNNYIDDLQKLRNTVDSRLSWMAASLMSTGQIIGVNTEGGDVWYKHKAEIPASNFVKAGGDNVWSDPNCDLVKQMRQIEQDYRESTGDEQPMKWNITLNMWRNIFMKNAQLKADIINYRKLNIEAYSINGTLAEDWVNEYLNALGLLSPIEIVKEGEVEVEKGLDNRRSVKGWADNIAVFRPRGNAGEFEYTSNLDMLFAQKYQSPSVVKTTASLSGGLMGLILSTVDNAGYPEWHTDLFCSATPALTEFPYHVIVNTATAGIGAIA